MDLVGRMLGNRYEIIEKIGNGGMATVYRAKCHVLKRDVAVKILRDEFTTDNEFIKRFNIEAQSVASLTHPNIVSVYDVGQDGNLYYIVMELVKGKTLKEIIVEEGKLGWKWSVQIAKQIASALEKAHRNNIIHRDIKPHNIIITEEGTAKVTDFGIAKAVSNSTITAFGATIGSVHYFSPEHASGGYTDAKSDLYSLGVVMYEMVTGRVPFEADTAVSVALKHMQEEPIPPIKLNPEIPMSVNNIIMKAMKKDLNERYQTATEMIADLSIALKNPTGNFVTSDSAEFIPPKSVTRMEKKEDMKKEKKPGKFARIKEFFSNHPVVKWITIILLLMIVFMASVFGTYFALRGSKTPDVQVPELVGLTVDEAKKKAEEAKLSVNVSEEKFDLTIEEGKIISQDPKYQASFTIKQGTTINIVVSKGQEMVKVPKLVGVTKDEAMKTLKELNLELDITEENNDEVEKGYIIEQAVAEGEEILAGSKIGVKISLGIEQVKVPNLTGKTETEAKAAIETAKLKWKSTTKINDPSKAKGVIEQSVTSDSTVDKDTEITITVNEYDELKQGTVTINLKSLLNYSDIYIEDEETGEKVLQEPEKVTLKVMVDSDTVYSTQHKKNETSISVPMSGKGTVTVKIYVNDVLKKTSSMNLNNTTTLTVE